jgi:predicted DCC family thiol-disulfide oxidoreductase YuxK
MNYSSPNASDKKSDSVYFDGECPLCLAVVDTVKNEARSDSPVFFDVHKEVLPEGVSKAAALKAMHVVTKDGEVKKSAAALFSLLELVPRYRWIIRVAKLPLLLPIMELGYKLLSPQRHWLYGLRGRVTAISAITVIGLLVAILLSAPLWFANRPFPLVPIITAPVWLHSLFLIFLIASPLVAIVFKRLRIGFTLLAFSIVGLVLFDQMRLQPWVLHYTAIILLLASFSWQKHDEGGINRTLNAARIIVIAMYFWSGMQKLNPYFFGEVFPWLAKDITNSLNPELTLAVFSVGLLIPFLEIAVAVCLLFAPLRKWGITLAFAMLVFVFITIGPFGAAINSVVWPWNIALFLMALVLFAGPVNLAHKDLLDWNSKIKKIVIIVFLVMPAFSFFTPYDSYLSWSLYSGTVNQATLILNESAFKALPKSAQVAAKPFEVSWKLTLLDWSFATLNVPPYPEERVFKNILGIICNSLPEGSELMMETTGRRFYTAGVGPEQYYCSKNKNSQ